MFLRRVSQIGLSAALFATLAACGSSNPASEPSDGSAEDVTVPDANVNQTTDAAPDAGVDGSSSVPDATVNDGATPPEDAAVEGAGIDASTSDAGQDSGIDAGGDAAPEAAADAAPEASDDGGIDATADAASDAAGEASVDAAAGSTVLVLGGSATSILGAEFHPGGSWATTALTGATSFAPDLTITSGGTGVGLFTSTTGALVTSTLWTSGGGWQTPSTVSATAVSRAQPQIDATGGTVAHATYQDSSYDFWYVAYASGSWSTPQAIGTSTAQSYGPVPAAIAALGTNATVAFIDGQSPDINYVAEEDLLSGTWQPRADIAGPESFTISPSLVPLSAGPELMMVFVQQSTQIMFATRTSGTWSTPAAVTSALTGNGVGLAPLPGGGAVLAFRGTDTNLYWSVYSGGAWSTVAAFSSPNVAIDTSPAVTHGVGGDVAEIAYVTGGQAYSASLVGSTWSAPVSVGGSGLLGVAIASTP